VRHFIDLSPRSKLGKGLGVLATCKGFAPDVGLERGRELREETSTSLHHHPVLQSDWRKPLSPLQVGCKTELEK